MGCSTLRREVCSGATKLYAPGSAYRWFYCSSCLLRYSSYCKLIVISLPCPTLPGCTVWAKKSSHYAAVVRSFYGPTTLCYGTLRWRSNFSTLYFAIYYAALVRCPTLHILSRTRYLSFSTICTTKNLSE